ncbi:MAG: hydrogen peroxide-inducible genes activator [Hyphomicrobiales bacterium]|nr:hydrogen peroxide-inducible genes activator [Hyphomicrobiales bacterium]MBV8827034.1 hydrogen peroxide-inducible genes activator [Hyphomicrobiales bacterium]
MLSLRQLRYFASLARHRHFGHAADDCAVTQPALSMQIRELEREIGAELVERRPGEVALTATGIEVAARAEHILAAARDLVDFARHREILSGVLKLGIIPTIAPYLLPRLLPHLQHAYPSLRLDMRETQTAVLIGELIAGELDCVLLALPIKHADVETAALFRDRFLLAAPAHEPMPRRALKAEDVNEHRLILLEEGHCLRDQALAFCATRRGDSAAALGSTSLATVMQMVANGYGITLLPEIAADLEARDERVTLKRFRAPEPGRTIGLAWRKTSPRRRDFAALGEAVKQAAGK